MKETKYTDTLGPINGYTFTDVRFDVDDGFIGYTVHDGEFTINRGEFFSLHFFGTPTRISASVDGGFGRHGIADDSPEHNIMYYDVYNDEDWDAQFLTQVCAIVEGV